MEPLFIQVLSAIPILKYFADFYHQVIPEADSRTATWALMSSPDVPAAIVLAYLFTVVILGPCIMRYIKIPEINNILVIYNSFVLTLNLWLGISLTWHILIAGYHLSCQKVANVGIHENAIASLLWVFHFSKIIELTDTLFLVLKRKENHLTFLHLYHHSTIVIATWIGVRFVPGGSSAIIAMVNSWIHVFMYFYYEMMVLRVKTFRNYKKIVTILQIVQFLATIVHCTTSLRKDCGYPRWILTWLLLYMISFLVLFVHFYIQTYWKPKKGSSSTSVVSSDTEEKEVKGFDRDIGEIESGITTAFSDDEDQEDLVKRKSGEADNRDTKVTRNEKVTEASSNTRGSSDFDILEYDSDELVSTDDSIESDVSLDENENDEAELGIKHCGSGVVNYTS